MSGDQTGEQITDWSGTMTRRKRTREESRTFKTRIADLKMQGKPAAEIAMELGVTKQYVYLVLAQAGIADRKGHYGSRKPK